MGTRRVQMKEILSSFLGWFIGLVVPIQEISVLPLAALVGPNKIFFSSTYTISIPLSPSPSKLGRQPCWATCLLACDLVTLHGHFARMLKGVCPLSNTNCPILTFSNCIIEVRTRITNLELNHKVCWDDGHVKNKSGIF